MIVAFVNDLFFSSKIKQVALGLGKNVLFIKDKHEMERFLKSPESVNTKLIILDLDSRELDFKGIVEKIRKGGNLNNVKIAGYCPHVKTDVIKKAKELGVDAMPKSAFSSRLGELLKR